MVVPKEGFPDCFEKKPRNKSIVSQGSSLKQTTALLPMVAFYSDYIKWMYTF